MGRVLHIADPRAGVAETIVVRGMLHDDQTFQPMFCGSVFVPPRVTGAMDGTYFLELRDRENQTLNREPMAARAPVVCLPRPDRAVVLEGAIALLPGATTATLLKRDVVITTLPVGPKPRLSIDWMPPRVVKRDKTYRLGLSVSNPTPDASVKVFYSWAPRKYVLAGLIRPRKSLAVRFSDLPGGESCRVIVAYSTGLRTTVRTTKPFRVPPIPPGVEIVRPVAKKVYAPWHPVELEGRIRDVQAGRIAGDDYQWRLNGKPCGVGPLVYVGFLKEGRYDAELTYGKRDDVEARVTFTVRPPAKRS